MNAIVKAKSAMTKPVASVAMGRLDQRAGWISLGLNRRELTLDHTLPTGQSFRWRRTGENEFTGVIGTRVVRYRYSCSPMQMIECGQRKGSQNARTQGKYAK
jgi:hypothetical protein